MALAHCMLDTKGLSTHSEYVISTVFPLPQLVARTRFSVRLYVHCLSC